MTRRALAHAAAICAVCWCSAGYGNAQGLALPSVGPVNRSMAGASVAAPLDATGALYWNPATLGGLPHSEMDFGVELLYTSSSVDSSVGPNTFGPGIPPVSLSGGTRGENGVSPLPSFGIAYRPEESRWTWGFGVFTIGGFGANYATSPTNPILSPPPPNGVGLGPIESQLAILEIAPSLCYQLTDHLFIGGGPTVALAQLTLDPGFFATPNFAGGFSTFPPATHTRFNWGAGFQLGAYYVTDAGWRFGTSFRSPIWFEPFRYNAQDENGAARTLKLNFQYPLIPSIGISYAGFERLLLAMDMRLIDYPDANGFGPAGFNSAGAGTGLGWKTVYAVATGAQYILTDTISLRLGYSYNTNPIPDAVSSFNIASSPIYQHVVYLGASFRVSSSLSVVGAYFHAFENSITGPILTPAGPLPDTSVTNKSTTDSLLLGFNVQF